MRRIVVLCVLLVGCKHERSKLDDPANEPARTETPQPGVAASTAPAPGELSGTVAETMDSGNYTYARLDRDGTSIWVAGPATKLAVGTKLGKLNGQLMEHFRSDTLKRTFDQIYFINSFPAPTGATTATATPPAAAADADVLGVVVATMDSGGYTYAQLDRQGTKLWVAGPQTKLAVGSELGAMKGSLMENFRSDSLNRTFDKIYFVNAYSVAAGAIPNPHTMKPGDGPAEPMEKIAPAAGGKTVADVIAGKDALAGKPVVVRGKVVKLNNGILGRNWVHLRDGTGGAGTNDLLVTTDAIAKVGDVVVARGTVAIHQDFGAGYKYDVIVEKATLADK